MSSKELSERIEELRRRDPKLSVTFNPERSAIAMLRGQLSAPVDAAILRAGPAGPFERTREFLRENRVLLGDVDVAAKLVEEKASTNRRGMTHVMFQQMHGPARLLGGAVSVHYAADGSAYQLKSSLASAIDLPKEPTIDADRAVEIAAEHAGQGYTRFAGRDPVLLVVDARTVHMEEGPRYYLCWQVSLVTPVGAQGPNWIYMVDAIHGTVLLRYPAEKTQTGTGYYSQGSALNADKSGSMPILRDAVTSSTWPVTTRPVIHTYDDNGSTNLTLTNYSQDSDGVWGDVIPAQRVDDQRPEVDIHRFAGYVLDYYYQTHKHNGWDGGGADLRIHAHNENMPNNAFWDSNQQQIYIADGDGATRDFIGTLDVVGHEFTHGVNNGFNIVQTYDGETGALDEAIADVFGALIALHYPSDIPQPWFHGQQSRITGRGRNLADPSRDNNGVVQYDSTSDTTKYNPPPTGRRSPGWSGGSRAHSGWRSSRRRWSRVGGGHGPGLECRHQSHRPGHDSRPRRNPLEHPA